MPFAERATSTSDTALRRLQAMGIDAALTQGSRSAIARMRLQRTRFETPGGSVGIGEVTFATVGGDRIKCLQPRALFALPLLRILDCRDATAIEARIHLAWQKHQDALRQAWSWLGGLGADATLEADGTVTSFSLAGEDRNARARMIDPKRVILPGCGPLSGTVLERADDRLLAVDPEIASGIELEIAVSSRLQELHRIQDRLAQQRRLEGLSRREMGLDEADSEKERSPRLLLAGPRIQRERGVIESLRLRGYRIDTVSNERDALAAFDHSSPELVIADMNLGRSEGIELVRAVRHVPGIEELPVLLVDSRKRPERREAARRVGAAGYLVYPIDVSRIQERLSKVIAEPRRRRYTRYARKLSVEIEGVGRPALATKIGRGGMFVAVDDGLDVSTMRACTLLLPEIGAPVRCTAEFLYQARLQDDPGIGVGVGARFHSFEDSGEARLIEYISGIHQPTDSPAS